MKKKIELGKIADFTMRTIMVFSTIVSLLLFSQIYNFWVFWILNGIFILSIIVKGAVDIFKKKEE